ncbi:MAG: DUF3160 domain-containing protein [Spirochaetales bacterium]|nr:DUF3160 domain-containing protein [Spirochaetales bacterium]
MKNAIVLFMFLIPAFLTAQALGDANKDGRVDIVDALNIARVYVGMEVDNFDPYFGDANLDEDITIVDSVLVAQNYVGIEPVLPTFLKDINITVNDPANWDIVMWLFPNLSDSQKDLLYSKGFVVLNEKYENTVSEAYLSYMDKPRLPKVITLDSFLHVFHLTLAHMTETVEQEDLIPALKVFLSDFLAVLKMEFLDMLPDDTYYEAAKQLIIRVAVAENLIHGSSGTNEDLPLSMSQSIEDYLQKVRTGTLVDWEEDYTSYKPRGHYANCSIDFIRVLLIQYFQSLTWLQRAELRVEDYDDLRQMVLFTSLVSRKASLMDKYKLVSGFLTMMKGLCGHFTYEELDAILLETEPENYPDSGYRAFNLSSSLAVLQERLEQNEEKEAVFRLMPKAENQDYNIMKNTHDPEITGRMLPSGMDVAASLFNSSAAYEIIGQSEYANQLLPVIDSLSQQIASIPESQWNQTIAGRWLSALRTLSIEVPSSPFFTTVNQDSWNLKSLNTQLSSWAEFYSDTANYKVPSPEPSPEPTSTPITDPPDNAFFRIEPPEVAVATNTSFSLEIRLDIYEGKVAAYGMTVDYSRDLIAIDQSNHPNGVSAGTDGFLSAVSVSTIGTLMVTGFDVNGIGPDNDLHLLTIDFYAKNQAGKTEVRLSVDNLTDVNAQVISMSEPVIISYVTVTGYTGIRYGDVNNDNAINIIDALLIAQYFVSLNHIHMDLEAADVNHDGQVNIVDALLIAQYYIGLIDSFPGVTVSPTPTPVGLTSTPPSESTPTLIPTPPSTPSPEPPAGYQFVEPFPLGFQHLEQLSLEVIDYLDQNGLSPRHQMKFRVLTEWAEKLAVIAEKYNNHTRLDDDERDFINDWGSKVGYEYFNYVNDPWFIPELNGNIRVIADVYNYHDKVLNLGVGSLAPVLMLLNYPDDARKYVAIGYILRYYELHDENYTRYTIEEWEAKLNMGAVEQPEWFKPLMIEP